MQTYLKTLYNIFNEERHYIIYLTGLLDSLLHPRWLCVDVYDTENDPFSHIYSEKRSNSRPTAGAIICLYTDFLSTSDFCHPASKSILSLKRPCPRAGSMSRLSVVRPALQCHPEPFLCLLHKKITGLVLRDLVESGPFGICCSCAPHHPGPR